MKDKLFGQEITSLFQNAGVPQYLFNCSEGYNDINLALNRLGEGLKKDRGWIGGDVYRVRKI